MKKYMIVTTNTLQEMERVVNERLLEGHRLNGPLLIQEVKESVETREFGPHTRTFTYRYIRELTYY
jgi:hypothetical protein